MKLTLVPLAILKAAFVWYDINRHCDGNMLMQSKRSMKIVSVNINEGKAQALKAQGWSFDWSKKATDLIQGSSILKAATVDGEIEGLVEYEILKREGYVFAHKLEIDPHNRGVDRKHEHVAGILLGFVAQESFNSGCDGFVVFLSKTKLYEYYQTKYGAKRLGGLKLYFDSEASEKLIQEYLVGQGIQYE
ncbi:MAG: hypothetical protein LBL23_00550 [Coriobacteriales bacterium]|jgi:hypothetical protein|nr:hypothetical protein [Coriobacteriales bacterium]